MVHESSLVQTPSMRNWYRRRAAAALLPPISAWWLLPFCCGSPLLIKEGGVQSVADVDPVCHGVLSDSSFCLRYHFLVLCNFFLLSCNRFLEYYAIVFCWCKQFRYLFDKLVESKILVRTSFKIVVESRNFLVRVKLSQPLSLESLETTFKNILEHFWTNLKFWWFWLTDQSY